MQTINLKNYTSLCIWLKHSVNCFGTTLNKRIKRSKKKNKTKNLTILLIGSLERQFTKLKFGVFQQSVLEEN